MLKRTLLLAGFTLGGLLATVPPALSQALTPYVLPLDYDLMAEQGQFLASEAQQLAEFQQFGQALALAQLAAQLAPNDGQVLALLGGLYLQQNETDKAVTLLERARTLAPNNPRIMFSLGSAYLQTGDYAQASTYLERGLTIEPNNPSALFDLGNAYFQQQQFQQAIDSYSASVAAESTFWPSVNNIGLVLYEQGETQKAVERWREALDMAGGNEPEPKLAIAAALYGENNCQAAASASAEPCQEALKLGIEALEQDSRYADPEFLSQNLWGAELLTSTDRFFKAPAVQSLLAEL
ncbi:MAG: tetratricopeptide repeat protein [Nodosilinea sp.]